MNDSPLLIGLEAINLSAKSFRTWDVPHDFYPHLLHDFTPRNTCDTIA